MIAILSKSTEKNSKGREITGDELSAIDLSLAVSILLEFVKSYKSK